MEALRDKNKATPFSRQRHAVSTGKGVSVNMADDPAFGEALLDLQILEISLQEATKSQIEVVLKFLSKSSDQEASGAD